MHLLVTRPQPDADATAVRLRALGHTVTIEALLTIVFAAPPSDLPEPSALIVTSRNGVRALVEWPQATGWRDKPLLAVGEKTAATARAAGFRKVIAGPGDAARLAAAVRDRLPPGQGPILHVAGRDRAEGPLSGLAEAGYDIRTVDAYRAERASKLGASLLSALSAGKLDGALFYSRRTAQAFRELVGARTIRLKHLFALSEQVAAPLIDLGGEIHIAPAPNEQSLIALIQRI